MSADSSPLSILHQVGSRTPDEALVGLDQLATDLSELVQDSPEFCRCVLPSLKRFSMEQ